MGHSWRTSGPACSSCSMTNSFVANAVLIERVVSCWHLHQLILQTTQYLDSWLSDLLQSKLKIKLLEVEGARTHSWRRHRYLGFSCIVKRHFACSLFSGVAFCLATLSECQIGRTSVKCVITKSLYTQQFADSRNSKIVVSWLSCGFTYHQP